MIRPTIPTKANLFEDRRASGRRFDQDDQEHDEWCGYEQKDRRDYDISGRLAR